MLWAHHVFLMNIEPNIRRLTSTVQKHNLSSGGRLGITGSAIISAGKVSGAQIAPLTPTGVFAVPGSTPLFMLRLFTAQTQTFKWSQEAERTCWLRDVSGHLCVVPHSVHVSYSKGLCASVSCHILFSVCVLMLAWVLDSLKNAFLYCYVLLNETWEVNLCVSIFF